MCGTAIDIKEKHWCSFADHNSKFVYGAPIKNKTSSHVADIVQCHILPMMIAKPFQVLSDNGTEFTGSPFKAMLKRNNIKQITITPHMSSSNGLTEQTVKSITEVLRLASVNGEEWDVNLAKALWAYNATKHAAIGTSPKDYVTQCSKVKDNQRLSDNQQEYWKEATAKFRSFDVGEQVLKKRTEIGRKTTNKLEQKFDGPFVIVKRWDNELTYILERTLQNGKIEQVRVHQTQMRKWRQPPEYLRCHPVYNMKEQNNRNQNLKKYPEAIEEPRTVIIEKISQRKKGKVQMLSKGTQTEETNELMLSPILPEPIQQKQTDTENEILNDENDFFIDDEIVDVSREWANSSKPDQIDGEKEENAECLSEYQAEHRIASTILETSSTCEWFESINHLVSVESEVESNLQIEEQDFEGFPEPSFQGLVQENLESNQSTPKESSSKETSMKEKSDSSTSTVKSLIAQFSKSAEVSPDQPKTYATRSRGKVPDQSWILEKTKHE